MACGSSFLRVASAAVAGLAMASCRLPFEGHPSIAGQYQLRQVDGDALPCCAERDSSDTTTVVSIVGGTLTLGDAAPEDYGYPPSGVPMAVSCTQDIPDGAWVDARTNVVHLPDGRAYRLAECGAGPYTMIVTRRYDDANGASRTVADTTVGRYTWGSEAGKNPLDGGYISLLAPAGIGQIKAFGGEIDLLVLLMRRGEHVAPFPPTGRQYEFSSTARS